MNLNPKNWYYPQWITNICFLIFIFTLPNFYYAKFNMLKIGGLSPVAIIAIPFFVYAHLHNFGLEPDLKLGSLMLRYAPALVIMAFELFMSVVLAIVLHQYIYWSEIGMRLLLLGIYMASSLFCFAKVETRSVTFEELYESQTED